MVAPYESLTSDPPELPDLPGLYEALGMLPGDPAVEVVRSIEEAEGWWRGKQSDRSLGKHAPAALGRLATARWTRRLGVPSWGTRP